MSITEKNKVALKGSSILARLKTSLKNIDALKKRKSSNRKRSYAAKVKSLQSGSDLDEIRRSFQLFDSKIVRQKHQLLGSKVSGTKGAPGATKKEAHKVFEHYYKDLGSQKQHIGKFRDKRFGEASNALTFEDSMVRRFAKERLDATSIYNLDDRTNQYDNEYSSSDIEESITHNGQNILEEIQSGPTEDSREKTKAKIMQDIIAKSKFYKEEHRKQKEQDLNLVEKLDSEFSALQSLLLRKADNQKEDDSKQGESIDSKYNLDIRDLFFERKSRPSDRTKSEDEKALEASEKLEDFEKERSDRKLNISEINEESEVDDQYNTSDLIPSCVIEEALDTPFDYKNKKYERGQDLTSSVIEDLTDIENILVKTETKSIIEDCGSKLQKIESIDPKEGLKRTLSCRSTDEWVSNFQRIFNYHHPKVRPESKIPLSKFLYCLLYVLKKLCEREDLGTEIFNGILGIIFKSMDFYKSEISNFFIDFLRSIRSTNELSDAHIRFIDVTFRIYQTSDFRNPILTPARLILCKYLSLGKMESIKEIARKIVVSRILLESEADSKRYIPELLGCFTQMLISFVPNSVLKLHSNCSNNVGLSVLEEPASFSQIARKSITKFKSFSFAKVVDKSIFDANESVLINVLGLLEDFIDQYSKLLCRAEILSTVREILLIYDALDSNQMFITALEKVKTLLRKIENFIECDEQRKPLNLRIIKPNLIKSLTPKFSMNYSVQNKYQNTYDNSEELKLLSQHKEMKRGLKRSLRQHAQFGASEKVKEQRKRDSVYEEKMQKISNRLKHFTPAT